MDFKGVAWENIIAVGLGAWGGKHPKEKKTSRGIDARGRKFCSFREIDGELMENIFPLSTQASRQDNKTTMKT